MMANAFNVVMFSWEKGAMELKSSVATVMSFKKVSSRLLTCASEQHGNRHRYTASMQALDLASVQHGSRHTHTASMQAHDPRKCTAPLALAQARHVNAGP